MENTCLYLHGCFFGGSWVFSGYFMGVHMYFFDVILQYVTGVPGVFLGSFCPIEFVWVAAMASVCKVNHPKTPFKHDAHTFESFWKHP